MKVGTEVRGFIIARENWDRVDAWCRANRLHVVIGLLPTGRHWIFSDPDGATFAREMADCITKKPERYSVVDRKGTRATTTNSVDP